MEGRLQRVLLADPGRRGVAALHGARGGAALAGAARALARADAVLLLTGFPVVRGGRALCETDGPYGTASLAGALAALGKRVRVLVDAPHGAVMRACLAVAAPEAELEVWPVPLGEDEARGRAREALRGVRHVVAVERAGPSARDGRPRSMRGADLSEHCAPLHVVFEEAREAGLGTTAVGDGGNELGMGEARARVEEHVAEGARIACGVPCDHLVVAGVSNWGANALALAAHAAAGSPAGAPRARLPSVEQERRLWDAGLAAGAVDGVTGEAALSVDGFAFPTHEDVLRRLLEAAAAT